MIAVRRRYHSCCLPHTFARSTSVVAQFAPGLVDDVPVVSAEERHAMPGDERVALERVSIATLGRVRGGVERPVGHVRRGGSRRSPGRSLQELLLGERVVVGDVVRLADRVSVVRARAAAPGLRR